MNVKNLENLFSAYTKIGNFIIMIWAAAAAIAGFHHQNKIATL